MSTVRTYPPQVAEFVSKAARQVQPLNAPMEPPSHTDDGMMFPWSIGTTRVAKEGVNSRRKEECPPEVYIG